MPDATRTASPFPTVPLWDRLRLRGALLLAAALAMPPGCRSNAPQADPAASSGPKHKSKPAGPKCAEVKPGAQILLGEPGQAPSDSHDAELALPFAVELGSAVGHKEGFAVAAIEIRDGGQAAVVALLGADGTGGQTLEFGPVHGGVAPPLLASTERQLLALVSDSSAGTRMLRLARIVRSGRAARVDWGATIEPDHGDAQGFGLAVDTARALVVWDEWVKGEGRGRVRAATVALTDFAHAAHPWDVSGQQSDVERPEVVARPGGFWLAWLSHRADATVADAGPDAARARTPVAAASAEPETFQFQPVVDLGPSSVEVMLLGADGRPAGPARVVSPKDSRVLGYDLALGPDGSAWLAWRNTESSPGLQEPEVQLARVGLDGSVQRSVVRDEQLGAGIPSLLVDSAAEPAQWHTWLLVRGPEDVTRIGAMQRDGRFQGPLASEALIRSAEPLALHAGRMLLGRPRGRAVELSVVTCRQQQPGAAAPPSASAPSVATE